MKKTDNLYHIFIFWIIVLSLVIVSILAVLQDHTITEKPVPVIIPVVKEGEFFKVGKYGNTIILDVQTERTNGKLEKQHDEAGQKARFLNGSQDKEGSDDAHAQTT